MEIKINKKGGFKNYCESIIQNSVWEKELKEAHEAAHRLKILQWIPIIRHIS